MVLAGEVSQYSPALGGLSLVVCARPCQPLRLALAYYFCFTWNRLPGTLFTVPLRVLCKSD